MSIYLHETTAHIDSTEASSSTTYTNTAHVFMIHNIVSIHLLLCAYTLC